MRETLFNKVNQSIEYKFLLPAATIDEAAAGRSSSNHGSTVDLLWRSTTVLHKARHINKFLISGSAKLRGRFHSKHLILRATLTISKVSQRN